MTKIETDNIPAAELLRRSDLAFGLAGMVGENDYGQEIEAVARHLQNAAFDKHFGKISPEVDAMSDDELFAELS
jgi:hypothetical protein